MADLRVVQHYKLIKDPETGEDVEEPSTYEMQTFVQGQWIAVPIVHVRAKKDG